MINLGRLVEEIKENFDIKMAAEDVYMNTVFEDLLMSIIRRGRGIEDKEPFTYDAVIIYINFKKYIFIFFWTSLYI